MRERGEDEDLAYPAREGEEEDFAEDGGVGAEEGEGGGEFVAIAASGGGEVEEEGEEVRGAEEVERGESGGEQVQSRHHLRAGVGAEAGVDVVLGGVGQAVEEEVDGEEE